MGEFDARGVRAFLFKIFEFLVMEGVVKTRKITEKSKTIKFYYMSGLNLAPRHVEVYYQKLQVAQTGGNLILYTNHFYSVNVVLTRNVRSGYTFKLNDLAFVQQMLELYVFIDNEFLKKVLEIYAAAKAIDSADPYGAYAALLAEFYDAMRNESTLPAPSLLRRLAAYERFFLFKNVLSLNAASDEKLYLPFTIDFRGRTYFGSSISPTLVSEFRCVLHFGEQKSPSPLFEGLSAFGQEINAGLATYFLLLEKLEN